MGGWISNIYWGNRYSALPKALYSKLDYQTLDLESIELKINPFKSILNILSLKNKR